MMEGLSTCEGNFQKLNNEVKADGHVDRISNLPDKIIHRILSLLRTKDAVRTSALSRRWRSQWMSITNLDFLEFAPNMNQKRSLFMDFVDRVIALRKPLDLNLFALACKVFTDAPRINSWVCDAVKHNVQHLFLVLHQIHEEPFELPHCLFTCDTLRKVVIMADVLLKLPSSIHFPNLKFLTLQYVVFPSNRSTQRLFSGLPVLEELTLDRCSWWNVKAVTIALPMLKKLDIKENVADPDNCRFFIIAENLKSFYYIGTLRNDYCIYDSVSLGCGLMGLWGTNDIEENSRQREVAYRADRLLRGISSVKELMLTPYAFEVLTYSKELYACMPLLYKLTCLGFLPPGTAINFRCGTLAKFLQKLPRLELLVFQSGICLSGNHEEGSWILDPVPSCFSTHLKFIKVCQFCGTDGELQVMKSLLKNAEVLLRMDIICNHEKFSGGLGREKNVLKQIQMFPRTSVYCTINFS
ncbi:F-box/LRR-repeat protein At3g26922-like [Abrus precatorius]|uniref:F-box/LRR-repeat protein At3g26922-like n=1 Tax=Abrus precatorius TaxID=3816 RepID=A0A8B8MJD7_ABRPR|nr:F-box/LRR-repeat protein At3g26922-like [Abrus precatorius]XP_027367354.1 F-box/LRR-repeat protein At3g26922-like [Abrus precatorius]